MAPRLYCIDRTVAPGNWGIGGAEKADLDS